jgi:hypothetical protein
MNNPGFPKTIPGLPTAGTNRPGVPMNPIGMASNNPALKATVLTQQPVQTGTPPPPQEEILSRKKIQDIISQVYPPQNLAPQPKIDPEVEDVLHTHYKKFLL